MEVPFESTPEQTAKIQGEYDNIAAEFRNWGEVHGGIVPPAISTFAEALYQSCLREMALHQMMDDQGSVEREPVIVISSALSFGMYLGMRGFKPDDMTMPSILTTEDERRLLSGGTEGQGSGGATPNGL